MSTEPGDDDTVEATGGWVIQVKDLRWDSIEISPPWGDRETAVEAALIDLGNPYYEWVRLFGPDGTLAMSTEDLWVASDRR